MGAPKRTQRFQLACLVLLVVCAIWLFSTLNGFSEKVQCVVDGIQDLKGIGGNVGIVTTEAANAVPSNVMGMLEQLVPLIAVGAILPAAVLVALQALLIYCTKKGGGCCSKCMMCLFSLFILVGIGFYGAIGVAGIAIGQADAVQDNLSEVCDEFIPEVRSELQNAEADLDQAQRDANNCPPGSAQCARYQNDIETAQYEIDESQKAIKIFDSMCDCMVAIFDELAKFTGPGFACAFFCFVMFILNCCACCCMGRAKKPDVEKAVANV